MQGEGSAKRHNLETGEQTTPFLYAILCGRIEFVKLFIKHGAKRIIDVALNRHFLIDSTENSDLEGTGCMYFGGPIMEAVIHQRIEVLKKLLADGMLLNLLSRYFYNRATTWRCAKTVMMLLQRTNDINVLWAGNN